MNTQNNHTEPSKSESTDNTHQQHRGCGWKKGRHHRTGCHGDGKWGFSNVLFMVLGFIIFWPVGLVILFWILSGNHVSELPSEVRRKWHQFTSGNGKSSYKHSDSDNVVFNEYQQTQFDRIREIKEEIRDRAKHFHEYRMNAKRKEDEKEFHDFMNNQPTAEK